MKIDLKDKTQLIWLVLIALTLAFIFGQSMLPASRSMQTSDGVADTVENILIPDSADGSDAEDGGAHRPVIDFFIKYLRKIAHFVEHGILGLEIFFLLLAIERRSGRERGITPLSVTTVLFSLNVGLLVGFLDETIQIFSGRMYSIVDVWLDFAGYATFTAVLTLIYVIAHLVKKSKTE